MRKIWPSEANCSSICENFAFHKSKCEFRIQFAFGSHNPCVLRILLCPLPTPLQIFSFVFCDVISFIILVINQSQAFPFVKDYIRGGNHLLEYNGIRITFLHLENYRALSFLFSLCYFLFLGSQTTSEDVCPEDERLNFRFLGVKEAR